MNLLKSLLLSAALACGLLAQPVTQIGNANVSGTLYFGGATTGGNVTGANGALSLTALGTNQNITLTPSGTGTIVFSNLTSNGLITTSGGTGAVGIAVAGTDYVAPSAYASANGLTMSTARLLGRTTASTGAAEEISVGASLSLTAGTLNTVQDIRTTGTPQFAALRLSDTDVSHYLAVVSGSNLTANRTLTLTTGDADRTLTINGNPTLDDWFDQSVKSGTSPTFTATNFTGASGITGTGALNSGSITSGFGSIDIGTDTLAAGNTTITGTLSATGNLTLSSTSSTPSLYVNDGSAGGGGERSIYFTNTGAGTKTNWKIGAQILSDNTFQIIPSTAAGGSTYSTAVANFSSTGLAVTGNISGTGVYSTTTASAANVFVDSNGLLQRSTSSLRYKRDVRDYPRGLADVMKLRPVLYKSIAKGDGQRDFAGLIAEEVDAAGLTEFVVYNDVLHPTETEEVEVEGKTVTRPKVVQAKAPDALAYANMVALTIKAIHELKAENDALRARVAALEARQ